MRDCDPSPEYFQYLDLLEEGGDDATCYLAGLREEFGLDQYTAARYIKSWRSFKGEAFFSAE